MKLRTSSKAIKEMVQKHILENLEEVEQIQQDTGLVVPKGEEVRFQLNHVYLAFKRWYGTYERKKYPNMQQAFTEWLKGLPSEMHILYTYADVHVFMRSLWEENGGIYEKDEPDSEEFELYLYLLYREITRMWNSYQIMS